MRDEVEITVCNGQIILSPVGYNPRAGWEEAFAKAVKEHGDDLLDEEFLNMPNDFDEKEWTW